MWMCETWHQLVGCGQEQHLRCQYQFPGEPENWMKVEGGKFAQYFAKYLGKIPDCDGVEIKGRWWGMVNKGQLPYGEMQDIELPRGAAVKIHRWARKLREKKAHAARIAHLSDKHVFKQKKSVHFVQELKSGRISGQKKEAARAVWETFRNVAKEHSQTLGPPALPRGGSVTLTFEGSVEIVSKWVEYLKADYSTGIIVHRQQSGDRKWFLRPGGFSPPSPPGRKLPSRLRDCDVGKVMALS